MADLAVRRSLDPCVNEEHGARCLVSMTTARFSVLYLLAHATPLLLFEIYVCNALIYDRGRRASVKSASLATKGVVGPDATDSANTESNFEACAQEFSITHRSFHCVGLLPSHSSHLSNSFGTVLPSEGKYESNQSSIMFHFPTV